MALFALYNVACQLRNIIKGEKGTYLIIREERIVEFGDVIKYWILESIKLKYLFSALTYMDRIVFHMTSADSMSTLVRKVL